MRCSPFSGGRELIALLIDNYDSFSYNLYQKLGEAGFRLHVRRNDSLSRSDFRKLDPDCIVISPGPGTPEEEKYFGVNLRLIREQGRQLPILGVCLGHQGVAYAFGGKVVHAERVMHGKTSRISHSGEGLFEGISSPMTGGRYHSLIVEHESLPSALEVTAMSEQGEIMGLRHSSLPVFGVQFHPESILTPDGYGMLLNFRKIVRGSL